MNKNSTIHILSITAFVLAFFGLSCYKSPQPKIFVEIRGTTPVHWFHREPLINKITSITPSGDTLTITADYGK